MDFEQKNFNFQTKKEKNTGGTSWLDFVACLSSQNIFADCQSEAQKPFQMTLFWIESSFKNSPFDFTFMYLSDLFELVQSFFNKNKNVREEKSKKPANSRS